MTIPTFTLRQMVEAGVHFGHHARRWNPQMAPYIYGKKDNVHIIDLQKSYPMLYNALNATRDVVAQGGKVLFVATKRQAQEIVKESAERCGQYYVNYRWLGGMLTNWKTVYKSITRLNKLNEMEEKNAYDGYTKKEILNLKKEREKLAIVLNGIKDMGGQPDLLFVIDTPKEALAVKEAKKLGIPVVGIVDNDWQLLVFQVFEPRHPGVVDALGGDLADDNYINFAFGRLFCLQQRPTPPRTRTHPTD
jgi:small subunit ribosomal protein S2